MLYLAVILKFLELQKENFKILTIQSNYVSKYPKVSYLCSKYANLPVKWPVLGQNRAYLAQFQGQISLSPIPKENLDLAPVAYTNVQNWPSIGIIWQNAYPSLMEPQFYTKYKKMRKCEKARVPPCFLKQARLGAHLHGRFRLKRDLQNKSTHSWCNFQIKGVHLRISCPCESGAPSFRCARSGGRRPPHPKDSRARPHITRGIRGDYVVVTPHKYAYAGLQGPLSIRQA